MEISSREQLAINTEQDMTAIRMAVKDCCKKLQFSSFAQTRVMTAASELARNVLEHAGCGWLKIEIFSEGSRTGMRLTFEDHGPGIADINLALSDGYSGGSGLGCGLGGAKRLMDSFDIKSTPGEGTVVVIEKWA